MLLEHLDNFIYQPPQDPLRILYEDRDIVVVNKRSGVLSVSSKTHLDSIEYRLQSYYREKQSNLHVYVVHRLDMDTSGIIVFALRKKAERELKKQFMERHVQKEYRAIVLGRIQSEQLLIDAPLRHQENNIPLSQVCFQRGRPSQTKVEVLTRGVDPEFGDWTRIRLVPKTGRSHQLRVHMRYIGHPILGDRFYGGVPLSKTTKEVLVCYPLHLHAQKLQIQHPYHKEILTLSTLEPFGMFSDK